MMMNFILTEGHIQIKKILILILCFMLNGAYSQPKKNDTPSNKPAEQGGATLAGAFGGELEMEVDPVIGQIVSNFSKDGKFVSLTAKGKFHLKGKDIELNCDKFNYDGIKNNIIANADSGNIIKVKMQEVAATCGKFEYDLQTKTATLTIEPKVLRGDNSYLVAPVIVLEQDENGNTSVIAKGPESQNVEPKETSPIIFKMNPLEKKEDKKTKIEDKETTGAEKITPENMKKIPEKLPPPPKKEGEISESL